MELSTNEQRVLGCLIEKKRTTPDTYPLSLNALRTACNQSTNRDPVLALTDDEVREACTALHHHGLVRIAAAGAGSGSRATKYRHTANEGLPASDEELALLAVLLLRGPQTRGELRTRSERIHAFATLDDVEDTLDDLGRRGLAVLLDREPGRKEARYEHQLGPRDPEIEAAAAEIAAAYRAELIADGALPSSGDERDGDDSDDGAQSQRAAIPPARPASPHAPTPTSASAPAAPEGPTTADLLARLEALERRVDELEELVSS